MSNRRILLTICMFTLFAFPAIILAAKDREMAAAQKTLNGSKDVKARVTALEDIGAIGALDRSLGQQAVPDVMKATKDKEARVRAEAALTLAKLDPEDKKETIKILVALLKDKEESVRIGAARGLQTLGTEAKEAIPALREAASKSDKKGMRTFKIAIQQISGKEKKN